jgi:endogenous inhibitor of DNA gyrase (YacG/DUF329 family)
MQCPICKKPADNSRANRFRPFCSERCQLVDLGGWAGGNYTVPGSPVDDHEHPDDNPQSRKQPLPDGKKLLH